MCGISVILPLALLITIVILISWAGDLDVARINGSDIEQNAGVNATAESHHVIVIGAGAAGISAAYTLEYLGIPYSVLEASSTFGGRVQQMTDFIDLPLDLGAEWIHVMPRVLQDLLLFEGDDASDIDIIDYQPNTMSAFVKGKRRRLNWLTPFYQEYKFANTTWWSYFATYFYPYIQDQVLFDAFVNRIEYNSSSTDNRSRMIVSTNDGRQFTGSHAIVAVPARLLQDREISFVPDLDEYTWSVLDGIAVADGMKIWFEWDKKFYPDELLTAPYRESGEGTPSYFNAVFRKPTDRRVQCYFNVNEKEARERSSLSDEELVEFSLTELEKIFKEKGLRDKLIQSRVQNWSREPFIRGAYTWNEGEYDVKALQRPTFEGSLFFAGEYAAPGTGNIATVHGAAMSGREAVLKIYGEA